MKDEGTKDGGKLEGVDSSGESVYSSAKDEFDEDYETTLHEPSAGRVVHRNTSFWWTVHPARGSMIGRKLNHRNKNWIKIHVTKICVKCENVCLVDHVFSTALS